MLPPAATAMLRGRSLLAATLQRVAKRQRRLGVSEGHASLLARTRFHLRHDAGFREFQDQGLPNRSAVPATLPVSCAR